jgi:hypothetical protein
MYSYHYGIRFLGGFSTFLLADYFSQNFPSIQFVVWPEVSFIQRYCVFAYNIWTKQLLLKQYAAQPFAIEPHMCFLLSCMPYCHTCYTAYTEFIYTHRTDLCCHCRKQLLARQDPPPHPHTEPRLIESMLLPVCMFCMCRDALCCTLYLARRIYKSYYWIIVLDVCYPFKL